MTIRKIPNAIVRGKNNKRNYVGDELDECTDFSSLYYRLPFEKVMQSNKVKKKEDDMNKSVRI